VTGVDTLGLEVLAGVSGKLEHLRKRGKGDEKGVKNKGRGDKTRGGSRWWLGVKFKKADTHSAPVSGRREKGRDTHIPRR
jgi:hypothetical protein